MENDEKNGFGTEYAADVRNTRLSIKNWSLELEFSQPNSSLRDRPG